MKTGRMTNHNHQKSMNSPTKGFHGLGIAPRLLEALERLQFAEPTPIQERSIPVAIEGHDLIGIAQTGTGKTLAFGIPMLQRLAQMKGCGLVLLPTRELALQIDEALAELGRSFGLRTAVLIGGASMVVQQQQIRKKPHVIIATPGRLLDHLERRSVHLAEVRILVLDEADRMLDMGFAPQINKIFAALPTSDRQTLLFCATMPKEIVAIAQRHMKLPISVEIARPGTTVDQVSQEVFFIAKEDKGRLLELLLQQCPGPVLVFTRTKFGAKRLTQRVRAMGHHAAEIHSNRSLAQRRDALDGFKSGKYRVLIATDIAARGIDVTGIELVVNFDLPTQAEDYVHRIGRTARAGRTGRAVSFAMFEERQDVRSIERFIRTTLPVKQLPVLPPARHEPHPVINRGQTGGRRRQAGPPHRMRAHRSRFGYAPRRFR